MSQEWKLVPVEPTDDMIVAFAEAWYSKRQCIDDPDMIDAYRDMLAAAPVPSAGDEVETLGWVAIEDGKPYVDWYISKLASIREGTELVDRAHVTRLQAELKDLLHNSIKEDVFDVVCKERDALKAERDEAIAELTVQRNHWYEKHGEVQLTRAKEVEIPIAKGCSCQNVAIGSYNNQVELPTPQFMIDLGQIGCLSFRSTTCVDKCVAPLVQALWDKGVITTGACCGHNLQDGYISIITHKVIK